VELALCVSDGVTETEGDCVAEGLSVWLAVPVALGDWDCDSVSV